MFKCRICDYPTVYWGEKNGYDLHRCTNCNYIHVFPIPTQEELDRTYDKVFFDSRYNPVNETEVYNQRKVQYRQDLELLKKYLSGGVVLDYGCGNGEFLINSGYRVFGYEVNPTARECAKKNITVTETNLIGQSFLDGVVMRGVIEHLVDPIITVNYLLSKVKVGGIFFICATPNSDSPAMLQYGPDWRLVEPPHHLHYFNPRNLALMFADADCELLHIEYPYYDTPYRQDDDGLDFINKEGSPAYPGSMMSLVFRKL